MTFLLKAIYLLYTKHTLSNALEVGSLPIKLYRLNSGNLNFAESSNFQKNDDNNLLYLLICRIPSTQNNISSLVPALDFIPYFDPSYQT